MSLIDTKKFLSNKNLLFAIFITIVSIIFTILMPIFEAPDEVMHLNFICDELNQECDVERIMDTVDTFDRLTIDKTATVNKDKYFDFSSKMDKYVLKMPKLSVIKHLPQALGVLIGSIFRLPIFITIFLAELFACILYGISTYFILNIFPYKKGIMRFTLMLPVVIQQMGSLSYDVMLNCSSLIFISYLLNIKVNKKTINLKRALILFLLLLVATICKIPYIILGLLMFLIPLKQFNIKIGNFVLDEEFIKKYYRLIILSLIVLFAIAFTLFRKNELVRIALSFLLNPIALVKTAILTFVRYVPHIILTVISELSWFDINTSFIVWIIMLVVLSIILYTGEKDKKLNKKDIIKILIFIFIFFSAMTVALYDYSIVNSYNTNLSDYSLLELMRFEFKNNIAVTGLQGRYFIPLIPLIIILLENINIKIKLKKAYIYENLYYVVLSIYLFILLLSRFWY